MKIFTYGTLMRGCGNHRLLTGSRLIGEAITRPRYTLLHLGGFPAAVEGGSTAVKGEVYEVDAATLADLDRLEGHPRFYRRTRIVLADGTHASIYLLQSHHRMARGEITSGDWREADRRSEMNGGF